MNVLRRYQFRTLPALVIIRKALRTLRSPLERVWHSRSANARQPYSTHADLPWEFGLPLVRHLQPPTVVFPEGTDSERAAIVEHCLAERFYVLGCGWMHIGHGIEVPGFGDYRYGYSGIQAEDVERGRWLSQRLPSPAVPRARWLWNSISRQHPPLDWQRDVRSGYRWSEAQWHKNIVVDAAPGADPKIPWELGRLQLLPMLSLEARTTADQAYRERLIEHIETCLLDFAAQNPPGYGIQWRSSMDVAIRLVNLLVTLDLISDAGLRPTILDAMAIYAYDHARFVADNLEWSEGMRGNHYLACVAGLAVASAYFPNSLWTERLRRWCTTQLLGEMLYQFLPDGGNFEASLAYHRLSAEMIAWAMWYLRRFPAERTIIDSNQRARQRLERIAIFLHETSYSTGIIPQIGDNDSGRFLWLHPNPESWIPSHQWYANPHPYCSQRHNDETNTLLNAVLSGSPLPIATAAVSASKSACFLAPDFGIAVLRAGPAEITMRAGAIGQHGKGGHAHNDQLSITLALDGREVLVDPGTYVYLASPALRNHYRSTQMHNTLTVEGIEQNQWACNSSEALFWLVTNRAAARIVVAQPEVVVAEHYAYGFPHRRAVVLSDQHLVVRDWCAAPATRLWYHFHPLAELRRENDTVVVQMHRWRIRCTPAGADFDISQALYSHSYGVCCRAPLLTVKPLGTVCQLVFRWEECS